MEVGSPWLPLVLAAAGFGCGVLNAMSGGGSFLTFPLLLWLGLPPQVANATNRIAITAQCIAGSVTYARHGVMPWTALPRLLPVAAAGALAGAGLAAHLNESFFRIVTAIVLVAAASTVFFDSSRWTRENSDDAEVRLRHLPGVFLMGLYGGFLQIGLGTILLAFFVTLGGFDVVRANALKFGLVAGYQILALVVFSQADQINWTLGAMLAVGTIAGGIVGAHLVVRKGTSWVRWVVLVSSLAAIVKLLWG